ncbi:hypothetical protein BGZ83_010102 [Gryganskiella cystojenkinii]|nr:hypothetical protein BGZ83_010102 [Gryganskiella cystojenkinii]
MHPTLAGDLEPYCRDLSTKLPAKFDELHANSVAHYPDSNKTVSSQQGQLLRLLMRMTRPKRVLELGCFMGFSAMAMADGLTAEAEIYTCEKDPKAAQLARQLFNRLGYQEQDGKRQKAKIELLEGDGLTSLDVLAKNGLQFDAVFIDADKGNYINYFNFIMDHDLLSHNGYILADNVVFSGLVLNSPGVVRKSANEAALSTPPPSPVLQPKDVDLSRKEQRSLANSQKTANHIHRFNQHVHNDNRVEVVLLPLFDGLSVIMRKA